MRKISVLMLLLCCSVFVFLNLAFAATIGSTIPNPNQEGISFSVGVEDNFIFERKIDKDGSITGGKAQNSNQVYGIGVLQPASFMTVYGKVGAANLEEKFNWDINRSQKIKFDYGVLAGGGINLLYNLDNGFGFGLDNQAIWSHNEADSVDGDNSPSLTSKGSVNNLEGQSTIYAKYDIKLQDMGTLIPYVGGSYSYSKSFIDKNIEVTDDTYIYYYGDAESRDNFGPVVGLNYKIGDKLIMGLEGRFVTETSIAGRLTYKF